MTAVLLAAGIGSRLKNNIKNIPKALFPVHGKVLIQYSLDFLKNYVDKIIVIGGYQFNQLKQYLNSRKINNLILIENLEYQKGSILTLKKAISHINDSFILMNIDHIYPFYFAQKIFKNFSNKIIACCDFDRKLSDDDMKIQINANKLINISKKMNNFDGGYIGITLVHHKYFDYYKQAIEAILNEDDGYKNNVEYILKYLIQKKNQNIFISDFSGSKWFEIDYFEDLQHVESFSLEELMTGKKSSTLI